MKRQDPSATEVNELVNAFKRQDFKQSEKLAKTFTLKYPHVALGWNIYGIALAQMGRRLEAITKFEKAIELDPSNASAHTNLGNVYRALGRSIEAEHSYRRALEESEKSPELHYNLATVLTDLGHLIEAENHYKKAIELNPNFAEAYSNLGNVLRSAGQVAQASECYRKAIRLKPSFVLAHVNLAATLRESNELSLAEKACRDALRLDPNFPEALYNLGAILKETGRLVEAEQAYRAALDQKPDYFDALLNLGGLFKDMGRTREAQAVFREAAFIEPNRQEVHFALGVMDLESGEFVSALNAAQKAHALKDDHHTRGLLVDVFSRSAPTEYSSRQSELVVKAFQETWCRPQKLTRFTQALLLQHGPFRELVERSGGAEGVANLKQLLNLVREDATLFMLIKSYLESAPLSSVELEGYFTKIRASLLTTTFELDSQLALDDNLISLAASLSMQCFINEYVFWSTERELDVLSQLLENLPKQLELSGSATEIVIAVLGSYLALNTLACTSDILSKRFSEPVERMISQQIIEPNTEVELRKVIPTMTEFDDRISRAVQDQYEENPYPRWMRIPFAAPRGTINTRLKRLFPLVDYAPLPEATTLEVLIAGCGTGQHPISAAGAIANANFLAIDLSKASLAYAKRKASELSIDNISFAQADILKLSGVGRTFDVIECGGVLHHMRDPFAAWDTLLDLLKPNGLMMIGLYSELARRNVVRLRKEELLANTKVTAREISRLRQEIIKRSLSDEFGWILTSPDFFSTSGCRDLLFHVQEHRMNLLEIQSYMATRGLNFLGFEMDRAFIEAYRKRFPDDPTATDLNRWHIFETENPDTFRGMYQFWVQKA